VHKDFIVIIPVLSWNIRYQTLSVPVIIDIIMFTVSIYKSRKRKRFFINDPADYETNIPVNIRVSEILCASS